MTTSQCTVISSVWGGGAAPGWTAFRTVSWKYLTTGSRRGFLKRVGRILGSRGHQGGLYVLPNGTYMDVCGYRYVTRHTSSHLLHIHVGEH